MSEYERAFDKAKRALTELAFYAAQTDARLMTYAAQTCKYILESAKDKDK